MRLRCLEGVLVLSGDTPDDRRDLAALSQLLRQQGYRHGGMVVGEGRKTQALQVSVYLKEPAVPKVARSHRKAGTTEASKQPGHAQVRPG